MTGLDALALAPAELALLAAVAVGAAVVGAMAGAAIERRRSFARLALALVPSDPELEPTETWSDGSRRRSTAWLQLAALLLAATVAVAGAFGAGAALVVRAGVLPIGQ